MKKQNQKTQILQKTTQTTITVQVTKTVQVKQTAIIGDYHTAPKYMKDNQHITHGYRINFDSPLKIIKSLFMIHNQSVNIWSHFIPAVIICTIIISFALIVEQNMNIKDLNTYRNQFTQSFQHFTHAIDNLTLFEDMKNMKQKTEIEIQEIQRNSIQSFSNFKLKLNNNIQSLYQYYDKSKESLKQTLGQNLYQNLKKIEMMKNDYQRIIAPTLIHQLNTFNNTYINSIRDKFNSLKQEIDSDHFKYMEIVYSSPNPHHVSRWPLMLFLGCAFICLICSTLFHLFYPMSDKSYKIFSRFDYAGISLLISGSSFPPLYYGMYCSLQAALVYFIISASLAVGIFVLSVFEWMHRPEHSKFKAFIYGGFGVYNVIPLSHLLINDIFFDGGDQYTIVTSLPYYFLLGMSYLVGLYIYTVRCPERHYPGRFNVCGHSHQIWHIFVVIGIICTYFGAIQNFQMRKSCVCPT